MRELSDSKILCGAWSEQVREFFVTSLDDAGQKIGAKMEQVDDIDYAVKIPFQIIRIYIRFLNKF